MISHDEFRAHVIKDCNELFDKGLPFVSYDYVRSNDWDFYRLESNYHCEIDYDYPTRDDVIENMIDELRDEGQLVRYEIEPLGWVEDAHCYLYFPVALPLV